MVKIIYEQDESDRQRVYATFEDFKKEIDAEKARQITSDFERGTEQSKIRWINFIKSPR